MNKLLIIFVTTLLFGCHDEMFDYHVDDHTELTDDISIELLMEGIFNPINIVLEATDQIKQPEKYTSIMTQSNQLSKPIYSEYEYISQTKNCEIKGFSEIEADYTSLLFDDGYKDIIFEMTIDTYNCQFWNNYTFYELDGFLKYETNGTYDEWTDSILSVKSNLSGFMQMNYDYNAFYYSDIDMNMTYMTSNLFLIDGELYGDMSNSFEELNVDVIISDPILWSLSENHPISGSVFIFENYNWIELSFSTTGVTHIKSNGTKEFWSWEYF